MLQLIIKHKVVSKVVSIVEVAIIVIIFSIYPHDAHTWGYVTQKNYTLFVPLDICKTYLCQKYG